MLFYKSIRNFPTSTGFVQKLTYLAKLMNVPEDWILLTFHSETAGTFSPSIQNPKSKATGLIQFLPDTAVSLGTTVSALAQMTHEQQMEYVIKYFIWFKGIWPKIKSASDVYLIVFYPAAIGRPCNYVLGSEENRVKIIYKQNSFIDTATSNDGVLTRADFLEWFYQRYKSYEKQGVIFERCLDANSYTNVITDKRSGTSKNTFKTIDYEELTITDNTLTNVQQIIDTYEINATPQEIIDYKDNANNVYATYRKEDKAPVSNGGRGYRKAVAELVRPPLKLKIPLGKYNKAHLYKKTAFQTQKNTEAFIDPYVKDLLENPNYIQIGDADVDGMSRIFKQQDNLSVYIWCKALGESGRWIDVSLFVQSVKTFQGKNGGNFQLQLATVTGVYNEIDGWNIPTEAFESYVDDQGQTTFVSKNSMHKFLQTKQGILQDKSNVSTLERNNYFFHLTVQSNDIVMVRLKNMELESNNQDRFRELGNIFIEPSQIPGKIYDMIGLVDKNNLETSAEGSVVSVSVVGRDLTKTIIEDGSYFFPISFASDQRKTFFENSADDNRGVRRIQTTGNAEPDDIFNAYLNNTIGDVIQFILSQEANIQVCPDEVFAAYPDNEKTKIAYKVERQVKDQVILENVIAKAPGIWQICKIAVDSKIGNRLIANHTIGSEQGSLLNHIRYVCQEPFVEFFTDTYGDKFFFIARIPPFDYAGYKAGMERAVSCEAFHIKDADIYMDNLEFNDDSIPTWFRLTPSANYFGNTNNMAMTYLKAVFLNEYAEIWGSKAMDITTQYITYDSNNKNSEDDLYNLDYMEKQSQEDLEYLVETNAYLPFTRQGKLTIRPNRAIKRGHFVYLVQTDEIAYVEDVTHNWSITMERKSCFTSLSLTRIMKRKYFEFYFKLVNLEKNKNLNVINIGERTPEDSTIPLTLSFEKNGIYLLNDRKLDDDLELVKSDYGYDDIDEFRVFLQERDSINQNNVDLLVRIMSEKMSVVMNLVMYPTEYDDVSNKNLPNLLATRGQIIKNMVVEEVRERTGKSVEGKITFQSGNYQSIDNSADFESIANITVKKQANRKNNDQTQFRVNRDVFQFFLQRKQFA
jgi:hypothetical protein